MTKAPIVSEGVGPAIAPMRDVAVMVRDSGREMIVVGQVAHPDHVEDLLGRPLRPGEAAVSVDPTSLGAAILEKEELLREQLNQRPPKFVLAYGLTEADEERLADWAVYVLVTRRPRSEELEMVAN